MAGRFKTDQFILYVSIAIAYLVFWIHNDLARNPGMFTLLFSWISPTLTNHEFYLIPDEFAYLFLVLCFLDSKRREEQ